MKKTLLISSLFVATALVSQSAMAEVKIRAGAASSTYSLGGDYTHAKSTYTPTNVGLTFSTDKGFYVDLAMSGGSGKHNGWATANVQTSVCGAAGCGNLAAPAEKFKRSDAALIFGGSFLNPNNGIAGTVYVGYKTGTTTLGAETAFTPGTGWREETFETSGVVFGGGASFPVAGGSAGSVGVNLGLGIMGATWKDSNGWTAKASTAVGGSIGVNYTYPITRNFGVIADLKANSYSYNFGKSSANAFTVSESITTLGASLYAKF